jgi:hypothetical protein
VSPNSLDPKTLILASTNNPQDAFARNRDRIAAIPLDETMHINVDVPTVVGNTLATRQARHGLRSLVEKLPEYDLEAYDNVDEYALATLHAHGDYVAATTPTESLPAMNEEAMKRRAILLADAQTMVLRGVFTPAQLSPIRGATGYRNVGSELFELAAIYRTNAAATAGHTSIKPEEIEEAVALATNLLTAAGARAQSPAAVSEASRVRSQAYTLFARAYDRVRQAVCYLRWMDGDADAFAPSLYAGRGRAKKSDTSDADQVVPAGQSTPPPPAGAAAAEPTMGTQAPNGAGASPVLKE